MTPPRTARGAAGSRPARLAVRVEADDRLPDTFSPLRAPRRAALDADGLRGDLLRSASVLLEVTLVAGDHPLPVGRDASVRLVVSPDTRATARLEVRDEDGAPVVARAELTLAPAVALDGVADALAALPELVDALSSHPSDPPPLWLSALTRAFAGGERAARVHVSRVHLRRLGPTARLAFDGHVRWLGRVPTPFLGVVLPDRLLPALHGDLARLLSRRPFAASRRGPLDAHADALGDPERLSRALLDLVAELDGTLALAVDPLELGAAAHLGDGSVVEVTVPPLGRAAVSARVRAVREGDRLTVGLRGARLAVADLELHADVDLSLALPARADDPPPPTAPARPHATITLIRPARVDRLPLTATLTHPALHGATTLALTARDLSVVGRLGIGVAAAPSGAEPAVELDATVGGIELSLNHEDPRGRASLSGHLGGTAALRGAGHTGDVLLDAALSGTLSGEALRRLLAVTELGVPHGALRLNVDAAVDATLRGRLATTSRRGRGARVTLDAGAVDARLTSSRLDLDGVALDGPTGAHVTLRAEAASLDAGGLGHARLVTAWDLGPAPALLQRRGSPVPPFPISLSRFASGAARLTLTPAGRLALTRVRDAPPAPTLSALLDDRPLVGALIAVADALSPALGALVADLHRLALRARRVLAREGVREPRHAIARADLTRVLAAVLSDDPTTAAHLEPIVAGVTDGEGLDVPATAALLRPILAGALAPHPRLAAVVADRLDDALAWLAPLLSPTEPLARPPATTAPPRALDPALDEPLSRWPTAAALYAAADGGALRTACGAASTLSEVLPRLAPYLALEQLDALLDAAEPALSPDAAARARYVRALAHRAQLVGASYGGLDHAPQALAIGLFLADAVRVSRAACPPPPVAPPAAPVTRDPLAPARVYDVLLGPGDVARLLQAGLTPLLQGRAVQLDQRLLLDELLSRPPGFLVQVLTELASGSSRILAAALNALLDLEQGLMRVPLDVHAALEARLGLSLPRRADFMPGGATPEASYYGALLDVAGAILQLGRPYLALRDHLRVARRAAPPRSARAAPAAAWSQLAERAERAIRDADAFAGALDPRDVGDDTRAAAARGYGVAFERCAALLDADPGALALPWLNAFWARNHDALTVRVVVDNHRDDVDDVRRWLAVRAGREALAADLATDPATTQDLVDAVIAALYLHGEDRDAVGADPLVRLLLRHPPGALDFTVVSCMGVITEGSRGRELEDTFARLAASRGVALVRADTATFFPLADNAERVRRAAATVTTPWGWIGYSQGCANGLAAEARMLGGPPADRRLLAGLRCRHLLFSAANGSSHGAAADLKLRRALASGDVALKPLQSALSPRAVELGLRALRLALDSRPLVKALAGARSLSWAGVRDLAQSGQFVADLPTTSVRAQVTDATQPEVLELLANLLTRQAGTDAHDTQVTVDEAVAHLLAADNAETRALAASCVPARVQAAHHWAPLWHEVLAVRTERDGALAVYDGPRDRLVVPWIELNARFRRIRARPTRR